MDTNHRSDIEAAMETRRRALRLTWRHISALAGVSHETLRQLRLGESVSEITEARVEYALNWEPGSIRLIRKGMSPVPSEGAGQDRRAEAFTGGGHNLPDYLEQKMKSQSEERVSDLIEARRERRKHLASQGKATTSVQITGPDGATVIDVVHDKGEPPSAAELLRGFAEALENFTDQAEYNRRVRDGRNPPSLSSRPHQNKNT